MSTEQKYVGRANNAQNPSPAAKNRPQTPPSPDERQATSPPPLGIQDRLFYTVNLEIDTVASRADIPLLASDAEILAEALAAHRTGLWKDLDAVVADWDEENAPAATIVESVQTGEYGRTLEEIKRCTIYLDILGAIGLGDLRRVGGMVLQSVADQKGGPGHA